MKQATLIYNPVAGRKSARRARQVEQVRALLAREGIAVAPARTSGPGDATLLARSAVEAGHDLVLACGGDGTIYEVINGLALSGVPLAILPGGTANIIAKELRLPHHPVRAAQGLPSWTLRSIALGRALGRPLQPDSPEAIDRYFLSVAGVGLDAYVIHRLAWRLKLSLGVAAYVLEALRQIFRYRFHPVVCRMGGEEYQATFAVIQRAGRYAGWFPLAPAQSIGKPVFGISLFHSRKRGRYFVYGAAVLARRRLRDLTHVQADRATFEALDPEQPVMFELDGELAGVLPVSFEIVPNALTLLAPWAS